MEEGGKGLGEIPVLKTWPKDGGPFLTLPQVITEDPETRERNVGMYRMQVMGPWEAALHWQLHKVGARHGKKYREMGKPMPVAVALGGDPANAFAATAPLPDGIDEYMDGIRDWEIDWDEQRIFLQKYHRFSVLRIDSFY